MFDQEIEKTLSKILKNFLGQRTLTFVGTSLKLQAFWNPGTSKWDCGKTIDPLSLYLVTQLPERERHSEDDEAVATLSASLQRRPDWINSFQCGWLGLDNQSTSIKGFLLGKKIRDIYFK